MSETEIHGLCADAFSPILEAFAKNFEEGLELGASFALAIDGETVVDLWAGYADTARTKPWTQDTIVSVTSCSKVLCALVGLMLVDRGLLDLDRPITHYWPEFGQAGKDKVLVRHIFSHSTGVAGFDCETDDAFFEDWNRVISQIERQEPWWEPGTQSGYHNVTMGHLIGELVQRITGRTYIDFVESEILLPLNAVYKAKVRPGEEHLVAEVALSPQHFAEPKDPEERIGYLARRPLISFAKQWATNPVWFGGKLPALDGHTNAVGLTQIGSALACGGTAGDLRLLSPETAALASQEQMYTKDLVFRMPIRFGFGIGLTSKEFPIPFETAMHWGGFGGSIILMIPEARACYAYTPNRFYGENEKDIRGKSISSATLKCLQEI